MNLHYLELFYYVGNFGGISEALKGMPYGLQQPAMSGQLKKLENDLGVQLFQRRPFALTPAGKELFEFIQPFFSRIELISAHMRGEIDHHLRLAASASAMAHHLPELLQALRREIPELRLTLREISHPDIENALRKRDADVAIAVVHRKLGPNIFAHKLLDLPLAIAAPASCEIDTFAELASLSVAGQIHHPLISMPRGEIVPTLFQRGLLKLKMRWDPSVEVSELGLVQRYVEQGFGFGLTVDIPGAVWPDSIKKIRLPSAFAPLALYALHTEDLKPVATRFLQLVMERAAVLRGKVRKKKKKSAPATSTP